MVIKDELVNYVGSFSGLNRHFFDYAFTQKKSLLDDDLVASAKGKLSTYQYKICVWPFFIDSQNVRDLVGVTIGVSHLIHQMMHRKLRQGYSLHRYYGVEEECFSRAVDVNFNGNICGRADLYHDGEYFKLLEINLGTNVGGADMVYYVDAHLAQPQLAEFLAENPSFSFINTYEKLIENALLAMEACQLSGENGEYSIVIRNKEMDPEMANVYANSYEALAQKLGYKLNVFVIPDEASLSYCDSGVYYGGKLIGYLLWLPYEDEALNIFESYPGKLKEAWYNKKILAPSNVLSRMIENKLSLALLHKFKDDGTFSDHEKKLIDNHVPWSAMLDQALFKDCDVETSIYAQDKSAYVIKPCIGLQGDKISVGRYTEESEWIDSLKHSLKESGGLIQSFVEAKKIYSLQSDNKIAEYEPVWGAFFCGDGYAGAWLRMMPHEDGYKGVVNSAKGAVEAILYHEI